MDISSAANENFKKKNHLDPNYLPRKISSIQFYDNRKKKQFFSIYCIKFRVYLLFVTFNHNNGELLRRKICIMERENAFFKSSPVDENHLPQMNSEKVFFGCRVLNCRQASFRKKGKVRLV
jgi:hypothetical protein